MGSICVKNADVDAATMAQLSTRVSLSSANATNHMEQFGQALVSQRFNGAQIDTFHEEWKDQKYAWFLAEVIRLRDRITYKQ